MKLSINDLLYQFSYALDCVEHDLLGTTTHHGQRVACMSVEMGAALGYEKQELLDLAACAVLHDNALTEYIQEEWRRGFDVTQNADLISLGSHCTLGERNLKQMPFCGDVSGSVLYHHENADGTGPFGKTTDETPMNAQIIHLADQVDAKWDLSYISEEKYQKLIHFLESETDRQFSKECVDLFIKSLPKKLLFSFGREKALVILQEKLPLVEKEYSDTEIKGISDVMANIIDYKSKFTRKHSLGIAQKAEKMGEFYGYSKEDITKLYFAGALHDVGKLVVDRDILEKADKLTDDEYRHIQNHAYYSYDILRRVKGLEEVTKWASWHHEKLDGSGYPFGKTAEELNEPERLMCCLDIYQALTEDRPYKAGMTHLKSMEILRDMAQKGMLDAKIVEDIHTVFQEDRANESEIR